MYGLSVKPGVPVVCQGGRWQALALQQTKRWRVLLITSFDLRTRPGDRTHRFPRSHSVIASYAHVQQVYYYKRMHLNPGKHGNCSSDAETYQASQAIPEVPNRAKGYCEVGVANLGVAFSMPTSLYKLQHS